VELSTDRPDRGNPVRRELLGEHLSGLFLQRVGVVRASGRAASRRLRTPDELVRANQRDRHGTALAHMLRADADAAEDAPDNGTGGPAVSRSPAWSAEDQAGAAQDQAAPQASLAGSGPPAGTTRAPQQDHDARAAASSPAGIGQARMAASRLAAAGRPVSRRALRSEGIRGSNQALNALARTINAELAGAAVLPARPGNAMVRT
jgi:hypothetical protein